jgi:hypothetical protein
MTTTLKMTASLYKQKTASMAYQCINVGLTLVTGIEEVHAKKICKSCTFLGPQEMKKEEIYNLHRPDGEGN